MGWLKVYKWTITFREEKTLGKLLRIQLSMPSNLQSVIATT